MTTTKSQLLNKIKTKSKGAWDNARKVEPKARGQGGFPPGLKGLVACLKSWKLSETKDHDPMVQITGIVKDPEDYIGRRATIMYFFNESQYQTVAEALTNFANDVKLMIRPDESVPDSDQPGELPERFESMLKVLEYLCEQGRHFIFHTGQARSNGRSPNIFIDGIADAFEDTPEEGAGEMSDAEAAQTTEAPAEGEAQPGDDAAGTDEPPPEEPAAEEEPWEPKVGEAYYVMFKPTPRDKAKKVPMKIKKVDKKKFTAEVEITDPKYKGKIVKDVKWDANGGDILGED